MLYNNHTRKKLDRISAQDMEENKMARKKTEKKKCCKLWKFVKAMFVLCGLAVGGYVGYKKLSEPTP